MKERTHQLQVIHESQSKTKYHVLWTYKYDNIFKKQGNHKFVKTSKLYGWQMCTVHINYFRLIMHSVIKLIYINHDLSRYAVVRSLTKLSRVIKNY